MDIIAASVNPPPPSGAAGSSKSSATLLTAKVTRSVKREISVGTLRSLPLQLPYSDDLIRRSPAIKHGPANRFAETYSDSLYRFYDSQRYLSLLDDLKEKDSLRDVFRTSGNGELSMIQYREPDEVIVRHPDRSLPALSPRVPSDLEQLPCFSAAIDRLQSIDDELTRTDKAVVQDMVRLLRAVRTDSPDGFGTAEIRTYLCHMIENPAAREAVDTYLQTAWAEIPAGCTNDKSALIDHCVGWESCPYRMHGSVPLREAVLHRTHQGRQEDI